MKEDFSLVVDLSKYINTMLRCLRQNKTQSVYQNSSIINNSKRENLDYTILTKSKKIELAKYCYRCLDRPQPQAPPYLRQKLSQTSKED